MENEVEIIAEEEFELRLSWKESVVVVFRKALYCFLYLPLCAASWRCFCLVYALMFWNKLKILVSPTSPISWKKVVSS